MRKHHNIPAEFLPAPIVTKQAVAENLCVSVRQVDRWIQEKRIPVIRVGIRAVRFNLRKVRAAILGENN